MMRFMMLLAIPLLSLGARADENHTLIVKLTNLRSDRGQVVACLYRSEDGFPKDERKAWRRESASVDRGVAELRFVGVPPGSYAGVSRHLGPPRNEDARFEVKATEQTLVIQTVYL